MDKKDLQKKLNKPYSTDNWQEVVQFVFPNVQILNPPMVIPIDNDKVESFRQLGNVQLHDGKSLALFELKLKANVNIIRNRVELNNIVSKYIDQDQTHGVLSIFEQGGDDYRFTFSARGSEFDEEAGDFKTNKTDTKRFTYVLGKNESCKTPAQRFYELSENKNKAEIKDIENAFSVEKLSKAFFKEYKDQYTAFVNYMMQTPGIFKAIYSEDDKAIRDFVKILLGRIIFIKFVQKKGWMGVDASSTKWLDGDYRFLENGFANFQHQDLFYSTFLEPLFEALDEPNRSNDIFKVTNTRVPYLSGGLFELEDKKTKNINFPKQYFEGLFEFLDRYNFTIDENDTNDHEVGIDPEMLGHIFENLLEDNKDKGAFYTPKEIVRYMCQESLKEYLKTSLENNKQWPKDETEATDFEQALHNFVTKKEAGGIIEFEETIARALKEVKICDPAIGSGAFPMGLLNEIFQLVHKLHEANSDKVERVWELKGWQPNLVKQNIIQNSIYGVDIEKGAVDVARLRFWLSLIVDEPEPKALPHLDYKIVVGNSLVSKLDDTIIDIDWDLVAEDIVEKDLFGKAKPKQFNAFEIENNEKQKQLLKQISDKQKAVFDPNSDEEKLSFEIRNLKIELLCEQLQLMVGRQNIPKEPKIADYQNKPKAKFVQDQNKYFETLGWKDQITKLEKLKKQPEAPLHFFDWKLDFPEIMNEQVTDIVGFDIVIGNPPWGSGLDNDLKYLKIKYPNTTKEHVDSYKIFIDASLVFLKKHGCLSMIVPNTFLRQSRLKDLRKLLLNKSIISIVNLGENIFEEVVAPSCIIVCKNSIDNKNHYITYLDISDLKLQVRKNELTISTNYVKIEQNVFQSNSELAFTPSIIKHRVSISLLGDFNEFQCKDVGLQCQRKNVGKEARAKSDLAQRIFLSEPYNEDSVMYWKGRDFERYKILKYTGRYFRTDFKSLLKPNETVYFNETVYNTAPKIIFRQTADCIIATIDESKRWFDGSVIGLIPNIISKYNIKYILGLLNSKYLKWYYHKIVNEEGRVFAQVKLSKVKQLPIRIIDFENKQEIILHDKMVNLVKLIISAKEKDLNDSIISLEQQIDNLVYKLYELTYDEVLVVEPEFGERMSRQDYEGLKVE
jgi:hypothetical protein